MGIKTILARRRNENRIKRRTRAASRPQTDPDADFDTIIRPYYRSAQKMYSRTQKTLTDPQRKVEGKALTKHLIIHNIIGDGYRALMGSKQSKQKPKRRKK